MMKLLLFPSPQKNPLHQVFYKIADEPWKKSDGDIFEVHAQSKEAHEVNVSYEVRYYLLSTGTGA